jgi:hypothetical protein
MAARSLHRQIMMERQVVATEQVDLHLLWTERYIYLKPLPAYLLSYDFWLDNLCSDHELHASACGFLLSYVWLINREVDFTMATMVGGAGPFCPPLLPNGLTWASWTAFVKDFIHGIDLDDPERPGFNKRYQYGELRMNRLNMIYRLAPTLGFRYAFRGYYFGYQRYDTYFRRNFAWLIAVFAYITVILSAMQTGLGIDLLRDSQAFQNAVYGFSVFSILLPCIGLSIIVFFFIIFFLHNLMSTLWNIKKLNTKKLGEKV